MFKLGDLLIDRIDSAVAEDFSGTLLYTLTQLQEATIEISAEATEAKDKDGTLVKKFWKGKTGTMTATNAMLNVNVIGANSGTDPKYATDGNPIVMPKIMTVLPGTTITLTGYKEGTVRVNAMENNGTIGKSYAQAATASETEFGLTSDGKLTPPTDAEAVKFIIKYDRDVNDGIQIVNRADKFPGTVRLTMKALCVDPCSADTLRACYIVLPSFQVSPEVSFSLKSDSTIEYKGDLQVDYCGTEKTLYEVYMAADDEEND